MLHADLFLRTPSRARPSFYNNEIRSVQLYGTQPDTLAEAAQRLVHQYQVVHIDLNFGCPAPKIIKKGGGAAVPEDELRLAAIVSAVVQAVSGTAAVTCKMRLGVRSDTFLTAGKIIEACGANAITLHTRTADEAYDRGVARRKWDRLRMLKDAVNIPVFGNGDVFTAMDAADMINQSACAGVAIGRGCLGRPWLFADIANIMNGEEGQLTIPSCEVVRDVMLSHLEELHQWQMGRGMDENRSVRAMRKWYGWYFQGYVGMEQVVASACAEDQWHNVRAMFERWHGHVHVDEQAVIRERGKLGRE